MAGLGSSISRCRSCFAFDGPIREVLHSFKYGDRLDLLRFLAAELSAEAALLGPVDLIVPVPLHPRRLRARGFNQSALIARRLSRLMQTPAKLDAIARVRDIPPQVGLERAARIENVKGAFEVPARFEEAIRGARALVVDDVMTTGATLHACAAALKRAGAGEVVAATVARAL